MCCVDPWPVIFWALEARFVVDHAAYEGTHEENLGELAARVQRVGSEIGVDLIEGCEFCGGEGGAVKIGGLEDKAGVRRRLETGKEGESEKHLRKVVDLKVGVWIGCIRDKHLAVSLPGLRMEFAPMPSAVSLYFPTPWPALQMS